MDKMYMYGYPDMTQAETKQANDWGLKAQSVTTTPVIELRERIVTAVLGFTTKGDSIEDVLEASRIIEGYILNG